MWRPGPSLSTRSTERSAGRPSLPPERSKIQPLWMVNFGAGEGNRTLVVSLEGFCSTIELHPHFQPLSPCAEPSFYTSLYSCGRVSGADAAAECHDRLRVVNVH